MELCQRVLDGRMNGKQMCLYQFSRKRDVKNDNTYRKAKLLEHGMKIVERVLKGRTRQLVNIDAMQFGFMPGRGTADALFVVRRIQEEYRDKKIKLYVCFVDIKKAFDSSKKGDRVGNEKGLPELIVRAVMSLYHGAKTKVRVGTELSQEFLVQVGVHQGSVLSPLFAITVNAIMKNTRGVMNEIFLCRCLGVIE